MFETQKKKTKNDRKDTNYTNFSRPSGTMLSVKTANEIHIQKSLSRDGSVES